MSKLVQKYQSPSGPLVGKNALQSTQPTVVFGWRYPTDGPTLQERAAAAVKADAARRAENARRSAAVRSSKAFQEQVKADTQRRINQNQTASSDATSTLGTRLDANSKTIDKQNKRLDEMNRTNAEGAEVFANSKQESKDFYNSPEYLARLTDALPSYEIPSALSDINQLVDGATAKVVDNREMNYITDGVKSDDYEYRGLYVPPENAPDNVILRCIYGRHHRRPPQIYLNRSYIDGPGMQATSTHELSHWTELQYDPKLREWNNQLLNGALDPNADAYFRDPSEVRARALPIWLKWRRVRDDYGGNFRYWIRYQKYDPEIGKSLRELLKTFDTMDDLYNYLEKFVQTDKPNTDNYSITPEYKQYYT